MANFGQSSAPSSFIRGDQIPFDEATHLLVEDEHGGAFCYMGFSPKDDKADLPYYNVSVAGRNKAFQSSDQFVLLKDGSLRFTTYFSPSRNYIVRHDRQLQLPIGTDSMFGVLREDRSLDEDMTRSVFGATFHEIELVAASIASITGHPVFKEFRLPRVTFSKKRSNSCDLTGCLIPREFPYVAFNQAQFHWSHVSLHAIYRILAFFGGEERNNPFRNALHDRGIQNELIERLAKVGSTPIDMLLRSKYE